MPPPCPALPYPPRQADPQTSASPTVISSLAFIVCAADLCPHQPVPTFFPTNSFGLALWKPTQSSYLPKETFQKTQRTEFFMVYVRF